MKLVEAQEEQVVRNRRNGHFYRYVRREGRRVRIRPLELFPNGLLQEKTTDTIVEPDLEIDVICEWSTGVFVEAKAGKSQASYQKELAKLRQERVALEEQMEVIDPKERGSHANKVKAVVGRLETVERGLRSRPQTATVSTVQTVDERAASLFKQDDIVLLPSSKPGRIAKVERKGDKVFARVLIKPTGGDIKKLKIDVGALVPAEHRHQVAV